jgi:hypothetical protein
MKIKPYKIILGFFLAAFSLFGFARLYYFLTDDFRMANITYDSKEGPAWKTFPLEEEEKAHLFSILGQKFHYLGKGAQSYAFVSEDDRYVLKFFKFKHMRPHFWVSWLPSIPPFEAYKTAVLKRKTRKFQSIFIGYELAYQENKAGAELIYLHLTPTNFFNRSVAVIDKIGIERHIDLDGIVFLLQNKGEVLSDRMHRMLSANEVGSVEIDMINLLDMYVKEYKQGMYDGDHGVMHNTGFIGERPFHLDVGKLVKNESMKIADNYKQDLKQVVWNINAWIGRHYPEHYAILSPLLFDQYYKHTGSVFDIMDSSPSRFREKK